MSLVVVAVREGFYGNTLRHPGKRFALTAQDSARHRFVASEKEAAALRKQWPTKAVVVGMLVMLDGAGKPVKVVDWLADPKAPAPAAPEPGSWHPNLRKRPDLDTLSEIARGEKAAPPEEPPLPDAPQLPAPAGDDPPLEGDDTAAPQPGAAAPEKPPTRPARPGGPPKP